MATDESQSCSLAERGCVRRSFFVFFLYASRAVLKFFWKLVGEVDVEETLVIVSVSKNVVAGRWCRGVVHRMGMVLVVVVLVVLVVSLH